MLQCRPTAVHPCLLSLWGVCMIFFHSKTDYKNIPCYLFPATPLKIQKSIISRPSAHKGGDIDTKIRMLA